MKLVHCKIKSCSLLVVDDGKSYCPKEGRRQVPPPEEVILRPEKAMDLVSRIEQSKSSDAARERPPDSAIVAKSVKKFARFLRKSPSLGLPDIQNAKEGHFKSSAKKVRRNLNIKGREFGKMRRQNA